MISAVIRVTAEDISGAPFPTKSYMECPIARALRRGLPPGYRRDVYVRQRWFCVTGSGRVPLPEAVWSFIDIFDRTGGGAPFEFTIDLPEGGSVYAG